MKSFATLFLAILLLGAPSVADPISIEIVPPNVVFFVVADQLSRWADNPLGTCTGTSNNQCCTDAAMDSKCREIALSIKTSPDHWVRRTFTCLSDNSNWLCDTFITVRDSRGMYCETVPVEDVILADVATCVSAEAFLESNP